MKYQLVRNPQQMLNNWGTLLGNCSIKYNLFSKYMAETEQQVNSNTEQQVTSKTPATKQKNPKRVAAGKAIAERTRIAHEAQKKALIEAQSIIANNQAKVDPPSAEPPPVAEPPPSTITTTQWLSVISIFVSLVGLYYKREEIKSVFTKKTSPRAHPPSPVLPRAPLAASKSSIRGMD